MCSMVMGVMLQAKVERELEAGKAFLQGVDSLGRAVVVVLAANHNMRSRNFQETLQLIVYALDAAVLASDRPKNPDCQLLILFDLSGETCPARPCPATCRLSHA